MSIRNPPAHSNTPYGQGESNNRQQQLPQQQLLQSDKGHDSELPGAVTTLLSDGSVQRLNHFPRNSLPVRSGGYQEWQPSRQCLQEGDIIIISGVPAGSFIGYDTVGLNIEKNSHFGGVRGLPPGPHFIYGGSMSEISTRTGFWIISNERTHGELGEVIVKRWDKYTETLETEVSAAEIRSQRDNLQSAYNALLPYNIRAANTPEVSNSGVNLKEKFVHVNDPKTWQSLTFAIKGAMLSRVTSGEWNEWKVTSMDECKPTVGKPVDYQGQRPMDIVPNRVNITAGEKGELKFIFPPGSKTYSEIVVGRARSEQAMDSTSHIRGIIADSCTSDGQDDLIGELQFTYLTGVLLGNICCMEQWAHIVKTLFKAFRFAVDEAFFFTKVLRSFQAQLAYDDEYLQGSIFDHNHHLQNELKIILTVFKSRLTEQLLAIDDTLSETEIELKAAFEGLETWLGKWGWDLGGNYLRVGKIQLEDGEYVDVEMEDLEAEDERGEYAPVIVELDEGGREKGTIAW